MKTGHSTLRYRLYKDRWLYLIMLPGIAYFLLFRYFPMWGLSISFQNYSIVKGFWDSPWVGFANYNRLFQDPTFYRLLGNTAVIGMLSLLFCFPLPIMMALLLNEVRVKWFKRTAQTILYLPHFLSWTVVCGITYMLLSPSDGVLKLIFQSAGLQMPNVLMDKGWFRPILIIQQVWKESGWGTIVFLAALTAIDPSLYEAAEMDGASRLRKLWHITLPGIRSTIVTMLILRLGRFLDTGFDQIYNMINSVNRPVAEVFDTYIYTYGISQGMYSYSTAVGLFKSVIALLLVILSNRLAHSLGEEGIY